MPAAQNGIQQYVKLEERLVLLAWLNDRFGYRSNRDLLAESKQTRPSFAAIYEDAPSNPAACDEILAPVVRFHAIHWTRCGPRGAAAGESQTVIFSIAPST